MNKHLQHIDDLFYNGLSEYVELPPEDSWDNIVRSLDKADATTYKSKYISLKRMLMALSLITIIIFTSIVVHEPLLKPQLKLNTAHVFKTVKSAKFGNIARHQHSISNGNKNHILASQKASLPVTNNVSVHNNQSQTSIHANDGNIVFNAKQLKHTYEAEVVKPSLHLLTSPSLKPAGSLQLSIQQNTETHIQLTNKKSFILQPYFSFDHISARYHYQSPNNQQTDNSSKEKPDISVTVGALIQKNFCDKFSIQSGLLFSNTFTSIGATTVKALEYEAGKYQFKLPTTYGYAELSKIKIALPTGNDSVVVSNGAVHIQSLSLPLLLNTSIKHGRLRINAITGAAANIIISDKAELEYTYQSNRENETVNKIDDIRKTYFTLIGGVETGYHIGKTEVGINPVIRYAITPANKQTPVTTYPVNIGVGAYVKIKF